MRKSNREIELPRISIVTPPCRIKSPKKLVEAMLRILSSNRIIEAMGEKGRQRAEKLLSRNNI
jgi:hypothetical protein